MIEDTIARIEAQLQNAESLTAEQKTELQGLLATLKGEIRSLSSTHQEDARSIAAFAQLSTHEATRTEKKPDLFSIAVDGLSRSVQGLEESHPKLVEIVNRICTTLSNIGI